MVWLATYQPPASSAATYSMVAFSVGEYIIVTYNDSAKNTITLGDYAKSLIWIEIACQHFVFFFIFGRNMNAHFQHILFLTQKQTPAFGRPLNSKHVIVTGCDQ